MSCVFLALSLMNLHDVSGGELLCTLGFCGWCMSSVY